MTYSVTVRNQLYKLQIWDTAGQEKLRSIAPLYYRDAQGIIMVYDVTAKKTFNSLDSWQKDISENASEIVTTLVVGNKCDLGGVVPKEEAERFASKCKSKSDIVSAKTGEGVEEMIVSLVEDRNNSLHYPDSRKNSGIRSPTKITRGGTFFSKDEKNKLLSKKEGCCK